MMLELEPNEELKLIGEESWLRLPKRSTLVALKPLGLGTPYRESLTSYFQRLADAHCVMPRTLARELVIPRLGFNNRISEHQADRFWRTSFFNGMGQVAEDWARVLGELTSVAGLETLTLAPLRGVVGAQGTATNTRRWCPLCLEESVKDGAPYGQLLWEIGCVKVCHKHNVRLVDSCGCTPEEALHSRQVKFLPHVCSSCGGTLAGRVQADFEAPSGQEIAIARSVGKLLESNVFDGSNPAGGLRCTPLAAFLKEAVSLIGEGNAACIAKILNVSKGGLSDWCHGRHIPSLPQAVHIAETFGAQLAEVLTGMGGPGGKDPIRPQSIHYRPRRAYFRRNNAEGLAYRLEAILREHPPISLAETARRLGTSTRELNRLYRELATSIAARAKEWRSEETETRREERLQVVRHHAEDIANAGFIPTRKLLENRLTEIPRSFLFQERRTCNLILEEARLQVRATP